MQQIYLYVLAIVALETMAMTCFKKSIDSHAWFASGVLFYACIGFLLKQTFNASGMAMTNAIWSAMSVMATTIVGVLLFKESLRLYDLLAIGMIVGGVMILRLTSA